MVRRIKRAALFVIAASFAFGQPQAAPTFEVASIKPPAPSSDGRTHTRMSYDVNTGKLNFSNVNLKDLIGLAYKVQKYQISGPDFLETQRFDIVAKFTPHSEPDQLALMVQSFLADRFKLALHREPKELRVYELRVAKNGPKVKPTDKTSVTIDSNRTHWHLVAKATMQRLAELLTEQVGVAVVDKTGLTGPYDMTLDYAIDSTGADPADGPSLFAALQEQLGLKIESAKGSIDSLVIDHVERVPTEN